MAELISPEQQKTATKETVSPESMGNEDLVNKIIKLRQQSHRATKSMRSQWPENYDFVVKGKQWSIRRPKWRFSEVLNVTWADIMTEVGIQTDGRPKVDFQATEPSDFNFAEVLKEINDINWGKPLNLGFGWQRKIQTAILKSKLYNVVHAEVTWNKKLENGLGDVDFKILDPYGCYWDPTADDIGECRYFIYTKPTSVAELKKLYRDKADQIKPDLSLMGTGSDGAITEYNQDFDFNNSGPTSQLHGGNIEREDSDRYGGEEMALLFRVWIRDDTTIEELVTDDLGKEEHITRKLYPKGRYIEMVGKTILKDEGENGQMDPNDPNIFEDGLFPICTLVNYDYGEYAGETEVAHRKGPQKLINYTLSHIMDQFKMGSNPQKIVAHSAQEVAKKLTNEPGLVVTVPNINDIRYETGPGIASGSFNLLDSLMSLYDKVGGLQDSTRGAPQPGVTSGLMLEGFVEASQTRPRMKNRSVDEFLTQMGYLCASRYLQFYTVPRVFRVTNKEGFPEFVEFFITGEGDQRVADITRVDAQGQPAMMDAKGTPIRNTQMSAKGIPDVKPVSGSNLPFAKAQKTATALDLQARGSITNLAMLEAINWPDAKAEDEKVKAEQQAMAEAQAQQVPK